MRKNLGMNLANPKHEVFVMDLIVPFCFIMSHINISPMDEVNMSVTFILILDSNFIRAAKLPPEYPLHHKYQLIICYCFIMDWDTTNIITQLGLQVNQMS